MLYPTTAQFERLRQLLLQLRTRLERETHIDGVDCWLKELAQQQLGPLLLQIVANHQGLEAQLRPDRFHAALDLILANIDSPPTIVELAAALQMTPRSLQYLFKNHLAMSPKQFINTLRLNRARRALWQEEYRRGKVADIANRLGYWHMGSFAQEFRRLFNCSPTELLRKQPPLD